MNETQNIHFEWNPKQIILNEAQNIHFKPPQLLNLKPYALNPTP